MAVSSSSLCVILPKIPPDFSQWSVWTQHCCWNIVPSWPAVRAARLGNLTTEQRDVNSGTIFLPREEIESVILKCAAANTSGCWFQKYYINLHAHTRRVLQLCKIQSPSRGNNYNNYNNYSNYNNQTFTARTPTRTWILQSPSVSLTHTGKCLYYNKCVCYTRTPINPECVK